MKTLENIKKWIDEINSGPSLYDSQVKGALQAIYNHLAAEVKLLQLLSTGPEKPLPLLYDRAPAMKIISRLKRREGFETWWYGIDAPTQDDILRSITCEINRDSAPSIDALTELARKRGRSIRDISKLLLRFSDFLKGLVGTEDCILSDSNKAELLKRVDSLDPVDVDLDSILRKAE